MHYVIYIYIISMIAVMNAHLLQLTQIKMATILCTLALPVVIDPIIASFHHVANGISQSMYNLFKMENRLSEF